MALRTDLAFDLGEDWNIALNCFQADGVTALDLTGATAVLGIGGTVAAPALSSPGVVGSPATAGLVTFHVAPSSQAPVAALALQAVPYTIRVTLASSAITDQAFGNIKLRGA
jgi:hypothetical protein